MTALLILSALVAAPPLSGRVIDEQDRPVEGAVLTVWRCYGTCFAAGHAVTDREGRYEFETLPQPTHPLLTLTAPGRYEVSRDGDELSYAAKEPQEIDFVLGMPAAISVNLRAEPPAGWERTIELAWGSAADVGGAPDHRYDLSGRESYWGTSFEAVPRGDTWHVVVRDRRKPAAAIGSEAPKKVKSTHRWPERTWTSAPFKLPQTQRYNLQLEPLESDDDEALAFRVKSLTDGVGTDRTQELILDGGLYGPPLTGDDESAAKELLAAVLETAKPWLGHPEPGYSYTLSNGDDQTAVEVTSETLGSSGWSSISRVRGFAYMPPLRWLWTQPENVVVHGYAVDGDVATISYRLREPRGRTFGIGVGPWGPFTQSRFIAGTLTIDVPSSTVREHRLHRGLPGESDLESFTDYVACGDGLAPQSMTTGDWTLEFSVHGGSLWLLDTARASGDETAAVRVTDVALN